MCVTYPPNPLSVKGAYYLRKLIVNTFKYIAEHLLHKTYLKDDWAVHFVLSKSSFFITAQYNSCANRKIERSKIRLLLEEVAAISCGK